MNHEQILKKAIEKAQKNGWDYEIAPRSARLQKEFFAHDFAKAFWGDKIIADAMDTMTMVTGPAWKIHLRIMVLEKDPIKYLEKFL